MNPLRTAATALVVALTAASLASAGDTSARTAPDLRLVHLHDGLRPQAPEDDPARIAETKTAQEALKRGVDLTKPAHPLVGHSFANGRLYYVFFKVVENAFGDRPYVVQRIRKTERTWTGAAGAKPEEKVTWQVEAFKTLGGTLKQADQHHGDFGLRDAVRREIVKEYEIGFGEVPGACEGTAWPFDAGDLFKMIQPYAEAPGLYDTTKFSASRKWSLTVSFAKDGTYAIRSPELGLDVPKSLPEPSAAVPRPDDRSKGVVLTPGRGPAGAQVGETAADALEKLFGEPIESVPAGRTNRNLSFANSLTCNIDGSGKLNTVITRPGFAGKTSTGIAHGMKRAEVIDKLGAPASQRADAADWRYPGIQISFDGFDRVARLVVFRM